jgi:hypothetical protein
MTKIKLASLCQDFLNRIMPLNGKYDIIIEKELNKIIQQLDDIISRLYRSNNLRIFDPREGGMFRGNIDSRKNKLEHWNEKDEFVELFCNQSNLNKEVGFSRALFNSRSIEFNGLKNDEAHELKFLSYESPLIRKKTANLNKDIGNPFARCDLIAIDKNKIATVEVKVDSYGNNTRLPFALLEAFFYGYILNRISKKYGKSELIAEAEFCAREFGLDKYNLTDNFEIIYYIGAQKSYFSGYIIDKKEKPQRYLYTQNWLFETKNIEKAISKLNTNLPKFGGYIVFSQTEKDVINGGKSRIPVPKFENSQLLNFLYQTISELIQDYKTD